MWLGPAIALWLLALGAPAGAQDEGPTLVLGGDVIFDAPVLYGIDRFHDDRPGPALAELFAEVSPELAAASLAVVNLECPVGPRTHERSADYDAPTFAAPIELLHALREAGVDAVTVANNHAYDQGVEGLARTLEGAAQTAIAAVGAGSDAEESARAVVVERGGHRIALLAFTEGTNRYVRDEDPSSPRVAIATEERIARSVRSAREGAALVVVSLHWTTPFDDDRPTPGMERLARAAAESGADLVYGHGPHVPEPSAILETRDGRRVPVLYSLGNLAAGMEADGNVHSGGFSVRDAVLARVTTRPAGGRLAIAEIAAVPFWIASPERTWWPAGTSGMLRPLSVQAELERIAEARCGARCARWAQSYRSRADRLAARVVPGPAAGARPTLIAADRGPGVRVALAAAGSPRAAPIATGPDASDPRSARRGLRVRGARAERAVRQTLVLSFPPGRAEPGDADRERLRSLAPQLVADRALRVEIVARPGPGETAALALGRAHRACGLVAVLGPSRARFTFRAGPPAEHGSVTLSVR